MGFSDMNSLMRQSSTNFTVINNTCLAVTVCSPTANYYRNINGTCNNLNSTNLGSSNTDYRRLLTPVYADGIRIDNTFPYISTISYC